jgi:hypothetical protein
MSVPETETDSEDVLSGTVFILAKEPHRDYEESSPLADVCFEVRLTTVMPQLRECILYEISLTEIRE